jgi:hypothetical protein
MIKRHTIRKVVTAGLLAAGITFGGLASASGAQAASPTYYGHHRAVEGRVVSRGSLAVRYGPGTNHWIAGRVGSGSHVWISCKARGTNVLGNNRWYKLSSGRGWVSARYVNNYNYVRWCN